MIATEIDELVELGDALRDTQKSGDAVIELRTELRRLGRHVDVAPELWRDVVRAQRAVNGAYLQIFEAVKSEAMRSIK